MFNSREQNNKNHVLKSVKQDGSLLVFASDLLKDDVDVVEAAITQNGSSLRFASDRLRDDDLMVLIACASDRSAFQFASSRLKADIDMANIVLNDYSCEEMVPYFDESLLSNEDLMLRAIKRSEENWMMVSDQLKSNPKFLDKALRANIKILNHLTDYVIQEIDLAELAIKESIELARFFHPKLKKNKYLLDLAVENTRWENPLSYFDPKFSDDENIALKLIPKYPDYFKELSSRLKKNENVIYLALRENGNLLSELSKKHRQNKQLVCVAVSKNGTAIQYADDLLKADRDVAILAVGSDSEALAYISDELAHDPEIIKLALRKGFSLKFVPKDLQQDLEILKIAVEGNADNFHHLPIHLQKDFEFALMAVKSDGSILEYLTSQLKNNPEIIKAAIESSPFVFQYIPAKFKKDPDFIVTILNRLYDLDEVPSSLKKDKAFMMQAVKINGNFLAYASDHLKKDEELVLTALSSSKRSLKYANQALLSSREFIIKAMEIEASVYEDIPNDLKKDEELISIALQKYIHLSQMPYQIRKNPAFIKLAAQTQSNVLENSSIELRSNKEFVLDILKSSKRESFQIISEDLKFDMTVLLEFLSLNAREFEFFPEKIRDDARFAKIAVREKGTLLAFLSPRLKANEEIVIDAILNDASALQYAHPSFRKNKEVVLLALKKDYDSLVYVDEELKKDPDISKFLLNGYFYDLTAMHADAKKDKEIVIRFMLKNIDIFEFIDRSLKTEEFILSLPKSLCNVSLIPFLDYDLLKNKNLLMTLLQNQTSKFYGDLTHIYPLYFNDQDVLKILLKYNLSIDFNFIANDPECLLLAINKQEEAFKYASNALKMNIDFVKKALNINSNIFQYIPHHLIIQHQEIAISYVTRHTSYYDELPAALKNDNQFNLSLIQAIPEIFTNLPLQKQQEYLLSYLYDYTPLAYKAIAENPILLQKACSLAQTNLEPNISIFNHLDQFYFVVAQFSYAPLDLPKELRSNLAFAKRLITLHPKYFKQFDAEIKGQEDLAFFAICNDASDLYECSPKILENQELLFQAILHNSDILQYLPYHMINDWHFITRLLSLKGELLKYLPANIRTDFKCVETAMRNNSNALIHALGSPQYHLHFIKQALRNNVYFYQNIPIEIKRSHHKELMEIILSHSYLSDEFLDHIPLKLRDEETILMIKMRSC